MAKEKSKSKGPEGEEMNQFGGYSKEVMKHFMNPKNVGEIENPDGVGKVGNPVCGDVLKVYISVGRKNGKKIIKNIKFKTMGCAAAIATSDMIADLAKGKKLEEAKNITKDDVADALSKLPPIKMHCSNLASQALKKAIKDYEDKPRKEKGGER